MKWPSPPPLKKKKKKEKKKGWNWKPCVVWRFYWQQSGWILPKNPVYLSSQFLCMHVDQTNDIWLISLTHDVHDAWDYSSTTEQHLTQQLLLPQYSHWQWHWRFCSAPYQIPKSNAIKCSHFHKCTQKAKRANPHSETGQNIQGFQLLNDPDSKDQGPHEVGQRV